jgi:hypothetical protein
MIPEERESQDLHATIRCQAEQIGELKALCACAADALEEVRRFTGMSAADPKLIAELRKAIE